jgi:ribosomal protein S6/ribosomal protein S18
MRLRASELRMYECVLVTAYGEIDNIMTSIVGGIYSDSNIDTDSFSILHKESWGKRVLAYKIDKNKKAHYSAIYVSSTASALLAFEKSLRMHQDIMRFAIFSVNEVLPGLPPIANDEDGNSSSLNKEKEVSLDEKISESDNEKKVDQSLMISYKNPVLLLNYMSDIYKIMPKRLNNLNSSQQRTMRREIARARFLSIIPFCPAKKK